MPRKGSVTKRKRIADSKYGDLLASRFINCLMLDGKKSIAEDLFYSALDQVSEKAKSDPLDVFRKAIDNVKPALEVKSRRVGGANYQVPIEVKPSRREALSVRWIINSARKRAGKSMGEKLADELIDAYNKRGASIKKREEVHRMAEANKAFAHYRW